MPMIVVGADTRVGELILAPYDPHEREIRVFVSDDSTGRTLKSRGFKVAIGDVSDESHVEAASTRCFSAVLIEEAATDPRERSFGSDRGSVLEGWAAAVSRSDVRRVIWVTDRTPPPTDVDEVAILSPGDPDLVEKIIDLDDASSLR